MVREAKQKTSESYIHIKLGQAYRERKILDSAVWEFKKALELGLDNEEIHIELGRTYREKRDNIRAIEEYEIALRHNPSNPGTHFELGRIYYDKGDYDLAVRELELALSAGPDDDEVRINLAKAYRKVGEYGLSADELRKSLERIPSKENGFFRNDIFNELEISQRKTTLESMPQYLGISLTSRCNLRCIMCGAWENNWEVPRGILKEVIGLFPYLKRILWQGGEVFELDYFEEIFDKASCYPNLKQVIVTNGLLIDERWANKLASANVDITVSIDGFTEETYERIRRGARFGDLIRSLEVIKNAIKNYRHKEFYLRMNVVVMRSNYQELDRAIEFARRYGFDQVLLQPIKGNYNNEENIFLRSQINISRQIKSVIELIKKEAKDSGIELIEWLSNLYGTDQGPFSEEGGERLDVCKKDRLICYAPWKQLVIDWGGDVYPNCHCKEKVANVLENSLRDIWNNEKMREYRRKIISQDVKDLCSQDCLSGAITEKLRGLDEI
jgi:MoaA/NifB/PqqE/SkfB family radical SAM enzyme